MTRDALQGRTATFPFSPISKTAPEASRPRQYYDFRYYGSWLRLLHLRHSVSRNRTRSVRY